MPRGHTTSVNTGWADDVRGRFSFRVIPSWLASFAVHAIFLVAVASSLKSCGSGSLGVAESEFRDVGIYVKQPTQIVPKNEAVDPPDQNANDARVASQNAGESQPTEIADAPPVEMLLPKVNTPVIGGGAPPVPSSLPTDPSDLVRGVGTFQPTRTGSLGQGETSFLGIKDKATRFVYVLDSSGSMGGAPILVAKSQLRSSLEQLSATQQFQILFYNQRAKQLDLRGDKRQLYWATSINRTLAGQFIASISPNGGTEHMPALKRALRLSPEVIFFLTDADEPRLSAGDLNTIRTLNGGRTRIHCIEFGKGPELSVDNFLKRLARQNNGTYRYHDVKKFQRR